MTEYVAGQRPEHFNTLVVCGEVIAVMESRFVLCSQIEFPDTPGRIEKQTISVRLLDGTAPPVAVGDTVVVTGATRHLEYSDTVVFAYSIHTVSKTASALDFYTYENEYGLSAHLPKPNHPILGEAASDAPKPVSMSDAEKRDLDEAFNRFWEGGIAAKRYLREKYFPGLPVTEVVDAPKPDEEVDWLKELAKIASIAPYASGEVQSTPGGSPSPLAKEVTEAIVDAIAEEVEKPVEDKPEDAP